MKTIMFPGQGSQSRGMGGTLFDEYKEIVERADAILGYSIKQLCLEDSRNELNSTQFTQPALYVVNALSYMKWNAQAEQPPDFLAGHSLGEFNALLAAQCFDFETGLQLVKKRGELMSAVSGGGMAAILNATKEEIELTLRESGLHNIDLANYNTPAQIVISGLIDEIGKAQAHFQKGKTRYYPLNTSGAFHSRFMRDAQAEFRAFLETFEFAAPRIPVISNVTARPYDDHAVVANLSNQVASTVRWSESIQYLLGSGTAVTPMKFEEVGNGDVLSKLVFAIERLSTAAPIETPASTDRPRQIASVEDRVVTWNQRYPIGTEVKSTNTHYDHLQTRTEAMVLFGHRAAIYLKGYNGYFDLEELAPL